jgi:hypothetical protein
MNNFLKIFGGTQNYFGGTQVEKHLSMGLNFINKLL